MTKLTNSTVVPHIAIKYDETYQPNFPNQVNEALGKIAQGETGKQLLDQLKPYAENGKRVTIKATTIETSIRALLTQSQSEKYGIPETATIASNEKATELAQKVGLRKKGEGTAAEIQWNPSIGLVLNDDGVPIATNNANKAYLALAHELVHGRRIVKGTFSGGIGDRYDPQTRAGKEERRAVGIGEFAHKTPSENSIRAEHGEQLRTAYAKVRAVP